MGKESKLRRGMPVLESNLCDDVCGGERRDAAESRRRVLDAARALFDERGVDTVNMYEIGRKAGVGQGTLYRRYEHKGALCAALLHESAARFSEKVRGHLEQEQEPALAQLEYFLYRLVGFNEKNASLLGAIRDAAGGGRRPEVYRNPFYRWLKETVVTLLERAIGEGEISPLDVEYAADAILAPLNIDLYLFQRHELGMNPERITTALSRLVLDGLRGDREKKIET